MNRKMGFTLIELLTVVMIIAVLTAVAVPQYRRSIQRAQAAEALMNLRTIFEASARYRAERSNFPPNVQMLDVGFFDALAVSEHSSVIGGFLYEFTDEGIQACRLAGDEGTNAEGTYCFTAFYNNPDYGGRGAMICQANSPKYQSVCPAFGEAAGEAPEGFDNRPYLLDKMQEEYEDNSLLTPTEPTIVHWIR